jgi:hypothetical protein
VSKASSSPPPVKEPVRKSETNGQMSKRDRQARRDEIADDQRDQSLGDGLNECARKRRRRSGDGLRGDRGIDAQAQPRIRHHRAKAPESP